MIMTICVNFYQIMRLILQRLRISIWKKKRIRTDGENQKKNSIVK